MRNHLSDSNLGRGARVPKPKNHNFTPATLTAVSEGVKKRQRVREEPKAAVINKKRLTAATKDVALTVDKEILKSLCGKVITQAFLSTLLFHLFTWCQVMNCLKRICTYFYFLFVNFVQQEAIVEQKSNIHGKKLPNIITSKTLTTPMKLIKPTASGSAYVRTPLTSITNTYVSLFLHTRFQLFFIPLKQGSNSTFYSSVYWKIIYIWAYVFR